MVAPSPNLKRRLFKHSPVIASHNHAGMQVRLTTYGLPREEGEEGDDYFGAKWWDETVIAVLCDGVGSAKAGREAAVRAVETLIHNFRIRPRSWAPDRALWEFTQLINRTLCHESESRFGRPEMVSTLAALVIEGDRFYGLNMGDSRIYLLRDGLLSQLSEDHVFMRPHLRHVLVQAIGLQPEIEPHCFEGRLLDGDILLLVSDGVTNVLSDEVLRQDLAQHTSARSIVQHARELATNDLLDDMSAVVVDLAQIGKLKACTEMDLLIPEKLHKGQLIDGYELVRSFQKTERVWLATKDQRRWTLKFAPVEARQHEDLLTQFVKESWNATRISGEAFVHAFVPSEATMRYYVMEFVEAPSLKSVLRSRNLAVDETVALGKFLLEASNQLLRLDLVHGDIKPENILVISEYDALKFKLVDLGSATEVFSLTSRAGTASYLAPERFHGSSICERTEIFALGVTLCEALTQVLPFGEIERYQRPNFGEPKRPGALNPNVPPWLESVLLRAIAPEPERRYKHYSEMAFDLTNPEQVEAYHLPGLSLLERNPLAFYRTGFWLFFLLSLALLARLFLA